MAEPLTLTFGVELEFVLRFDLEDQMDNIGTEDYDDKDLAESARKYFCFALFEKGFPICFARGLDAWAINIKGAIKPDGPLMSSGLDFDALSWKVDRDGSITAPQSGPQDLEYGYVGIELKSPALPYTTESLMKIRRMCRQLGKFDILVEESCNSEKIGKFDILVNESCGLHVHVGNERKGFPLETMKNLCILTATFERELESLHPPHRIGNFYAFSIGSMFHNGISLPDIKRKIRNTETVGDLIDLVQKGVKQHAYNLLNLRSSDDIGTFEFRQHEATINADAITRWVELTCGLVNKAHRFAVQGHLNVGEMDAYIDRMNSIPHLSIIEIAKSLGLEDVASYYEGRGLHTHRRVLRSRAGSNNARTVTQSGRPENAMTPSVRPNNSVFLDGQQTVRTFMTSTDSRQRYEQAVEGYDAENLIRDARGIEFGVAGSEERAKDSHDDFDPASTKVQFFSWSMPVERLSTPQPNGAMTRNMSSTLPIMTRSLPTTAETFSSICKDLFGRPVSAPDMASYSALNSPIRKTRPPVSFNPRTATLAARSIGASALPLRLIYALGNIPKLGSLSRTVKPTWSAMTIGPKTRKTWTASTSDW